MWTLAAGLGSIRSDKVGVGGCVGIVVAVGTGVSVGAGGGGCTEQAMTRISATPTTDAATADLPNSAPPGESKRRR